MKETIGIFLAFSLLITMARLIGDMGFKLNSIHLGVDTLSQITVLLTPPKKFKGPIARYYANISMHLF